MIFITLLISFKGENKLVKFDILVKPCSKGGRSDRKNGNDISCKFLYILKDNVTKYSMLYFKDYNG